VYVDGNYKSPHLRKAGAATNRVPTIQHRFQDDARVEEFCKSRAVETVTRSAEKECNDFDADKELGRTSEKYDRTGDTLN
jgi:hypothetical protein